MTKDGKTYGSAWEPVERGEKGFSVYAWRCSVCNWKVKQDPPPEACPRCKRTAAVVYLCDPELNTECRKTGCFINPDPQLWETCRHTTKIECARQASRVGLDQYAKYDEDFRRRSENK